MHRVAQVFVVAALLAGCGAPGSNAPPLAPTPAPAAIPTGDRFTEELPITGRLFAFRFHRHFALFAIGPEGVVVFDPIAPDAAGPLAAAIRARAPAAKLRGVVYSHAHGDHAGGAAALAKALGGTLDGVPIVAHERMRDPGALGEEVAPEAVALPTDTLGDVNTDGSFRDPRGRRMLGGLPVEFAYLGDAHARSQLIVRLPTEDTVLAVDFIAGDTAAWGDLPGVDLDATIAMQRRLLALPFTHVAYGHAPPGDRRSVEGQIAYYTFLRDSACAALARGESAEQYARTVDVTPWVHLREYEEYGAQNLRGAYARMRERGCR